MKIIFDINCNGDALHGNFEVELARILSTIPKKIVEQLKRDGRCVCEALESADKIRDSNGNTVGLIQVVTDNGKLNIKNEIKELLEQKLECEVEEDVGIWYISTPAGEKWDMTVPERSPVMIKGNEE